MEPLLFLTRNLLAIGLGMLATFAFAPYGIWPLAIVAICGLQLLMLWDKQRRWARLCFCFSLGYFGLGLSWIGHSIQQFGGLTLWPTVGLLALLSVYLSSFSLVTGYLMRKLPVGTTFSAWLFAFPAIWLVMDWVRGWLFTGFPWLWLGYSQAESPLAGYAPLLGVQGITLILLIISGALTLYATKRDRTLTMLLILLLLGLGMILRGYTWVESRSPIKVALVQANIPQQEKWQPEKRWSSLKTFTELSKPHFSADLMVWPESAIPAFEYEMLDFLTQLDKLSIRAGGSLVTGIISHNLDNDKFYNTVLALGETGNSELNGYKLDGKNHYFKHHLLPIGEFVPFEEWLRPLAPLFRLPMNNFGKGNAIQPNLQVNGYKMVPAICYEILFSEQLRQNTHPNSAAILTVSNDAWFGDTNGPYQHLQIAQMRALEFERPVIRATNTGISAVINSKGKVEGQLDIGVRGVLSSSIKPSYGVTPYQKSGSLPLFIWCCLAISAAVLTNRGKRSKLQQ